LSSVAAGFNTGKEVDLILDRISLLYSAVVSFDDLPIPFDYVATDLVSNRPHVFHDGSVVSSKVDDVPSKRALAG
jgi:NTE family protein